MPLHDYQIAARDWLANREQACLFLDMGLGKTAATLAALDDRHFPVLVVAPKRVAEKVWPTEVRKWRPDLSIALAAGDRDTRMRALISRKQIIAIGRDNIKDVLDAPRAVPFRTLILDELSSFKSRGVRWKTIRKIVKENGIRYRWGLTGTPAPNGLLDLWPQMALIDDGARLGRNVTAYRSRYFQPAPGATMPSGVVTEWLVKPGGEAAIHALLEDIAISMQTEGRIELPPVTQNPVPVDLPPSVRRIYKTMKDDLVVNLDMIGGELHSAVNAATLSNKLSQIAAGFLFHDDAEFRGGSYQHLHNEKVNAVKEVVEGTGSPVLALYRYKPELEMLKKAFGPDAHTIDDPGVLDRWDEGQVPVLLAHPASIGHGLNMQHGGHTAVWSSLPWSLEEWDQTNKRLARQGQQHPVVIHRVEARKTIDPHIGQALVKKTKVQKALLDHLESPL